MKTIENTIIDEEIKYEERYCAFIDILGFKSAIENKKWNPNLTALILNLMKENASSAYLENLSFRQITQFSDSIVISNLANSINNFLGIVETAGSLSLALSLNGVFLRGGITKGELYHNQNIVFGSALIRAYHLEQEANTPRIILDSILEREISQFKLEAADLKTMFFLGDILLEDFDGWWYVNYFLNKNLDLFDNGREYREHSEKILSELIEKYQNSEDVSLHTKYGWIAKKFKESYLK